MERLLILNPEVRQILKENCFQASILVLAKLSMKEWTFSREISKFYL